MVTMPCAGTWTLTSGSCPGWWLSNGGQNMTCTMSSSQSATWSYTNGSGGGSRSVTFYHQ